MALYQLNCTRRWVFFFFLLTFDKSSAYSGSFISQRYSNLIISTREVRVLIYFGIYVIYYASRNIFINKEFIEPCIIVLNGTWQHSPVRMHDSLIKSSIMLQEIEQNNNNNKSLAKVAVRLPLVNIMFDSRHPKVQWINLRLCFLYIFFSFWFFSFSRTRMSSAEVHALCILPWLVFFRGMYILTCNRFSKIKQKSFQPKFGEFASSIPSKNLSRNVKGYLRPVLPYLLIRKTPNYFMRRSKHNFYFLLLPAMPIEK